MKKHHIGVFVLSVALIILIFFSGTIVRAVSVAISTDKSSYISNDSQINFTGTVQIESSEYIPIKNVSINITGPTNKTCIFSVDGTKLSGCDYMDINVATNYTYSNISSGSGLWGNDTSTGTVYSFGYGYGYGYGYGLVTQAELNYSVAWNFTDDNFSDGDHNASLNVLVSGGGTTHTYSSNVTSFTLDALPNITAAVSDSSSASPKNAGQNVTFTVNWTDAGNASAKFFICNTSSANTSGCIVGTYCSNATLSTTASRTCKYEAKSSDDTSNTAYAYVCSSVGCSEASSVTFEVNHAPTVTLTINPSTANYNDDLNVTIAYSDSDSDAKGENTTYKWYKNDVVIESGTIKNQTYNNTNTREYYRLFSNTWYAGQSFTPSLTSRLEQVKMYVSLSNDAAPVGTGSTLIVEIQHDNSSSNNKPNGTVIANATTTGLTVVAANTYYWKTFNFSTKPVLEKGTKYHIVIRNNNSDTYRLGTDNSTPTYTGGELVYSTNSGATWTNDSTQDAIFDTNMYGVPMLNSSNFDTDDVIVFEYTPKDNHSLEGNATNSSSLTIAAICGDGDCEGDERCSTCARDCGSCDTSKAGKGSGSAGGVYAPEIVVEEEEVEEVEEKEKEIEAEELAPAVKEEKKREVKPRVSISYGPAEGWLESGRISIPYAPGKVVTLGLEWVSLFIILLLIIALSIFIYLKKRKKKESGEEEILKKI